MELWEQLKHQHELVKKRKGIKDKKWNGKKQRVYHYSVGRNNYCHHRGENGELCSAAPLSGGYFCRGHQRK